MRTGGIVKDGLKAVVLGTSPSPGAGAVSGVGAVAVVEGLVGFAVARVWAPSPVPSPSLEFFASTVPSPKIALERLSKVAIHHKYNTQHTTITTPTIHLTMPPFHHHHNPLTD